MKVYLDIIFITNFLFDFILLFSVNVLLKRNKKIYKIVLGAFVGTFTLLILFLRMNSFILFLYKFFISIFMVLITFNYKNLKYTFKNLYFLYIVSIIMGGFLYFINNQISQKNEGLIFITNNFSLNLILGIILSILFMIFYVKETKSLKQNYNKYHKIKLLFKNNKSININGFLDTGNKLKDPYKGRPIILIKENLIDVKNINYILVPYNTVSGDGMLKCFLPSKMEIDGIEYKKKFLIGLVKNINIDGVECILNEQIMEEMKND